MVVNKWTRNETIVALYLYYIIPFQKVRKSNPIVKEYAALLGRSPAGLSMKIGNLGRFDPTLRAQNISGLSNGSKMDDEVWKEFSGQWEKLNNEFEKIIHQPTQQRLPNIMPAISQTHQGKERISPVSVRVNQNFFRACVLAAYDNQCCITGLKQKELLVASHIKPWKDDEHNRLNPQNGLCLNALHDKAFDRGLLGLDDEFKIIFSPKLSQAEGFDVFFKPFESQKIRLPERLSPNLEFLKFHRQYIFQN